MKDSESITLSEVYEEALRNGYNQGYRACARDYIKLSAESYAKGYLDGKLDADDRHNALISRLVVPQTKEDL